MWQCTISLPHFPICYATQCANANHFTGKRLQWQLPTLPLLREINKSEDNNFKNSEAFIVNELYIPPEKLSFVILLYIVKQVQGLNKTNAKLYKHLSNLENVFLQFI